MQSTGTKEFKDQFRMMVDTIPSLVWSSRPDGAIEFLNQQWLDFTGVELEQALGTGWKIVVHPDDLGKLMDIWERLLASGSPGELEARLRRSDGEYRWFLFRIAPLLDEEGKITGWYGTNTDIENLKRAEEKSRQAETELRQIVDTIAQLVMFLSPDGKTLYANRYAVEYTGLSLEELKADDSRGRVFHPDDVERLRECRQDALSRAVPFENEQRARRKDGVYRWFFIRYNALLDEQGNPIRWYAAGIDIEDRKRSEERVRSENLALREEIDRTSMFEEIVGSSRALRTVLTQVARVAPTDTTVLILGETGTGKELIARAIHKRSARSARAFIRVNCGAIPTALVASELFGYEKGAFTGALQRRLGRFEAANGGTIFLDEIGELPTETQIALLRVLQEREFERLGSSQSISVDVRVLTATNRDLKAAVAAGRFREDLFYRLNVFPIHIPSLRERADDIPLLVDYLVERYAKKAGKKITNVAKETLSLLQAYPWPGNIRELQNIVERAVILTDGETFCVKEAWLKYESTRELPTLIAPPKKLLRVDDEQEKEMIEAALTESRGRISGSAGAALRLGIPRQTLESKINSLGINKHRFR